MASVRKRKGTDKWIVDYRDQSGGRHIETYEKQKDARAAKTRIEAALGGIRGKVVRVVHPINELLSTADLLALPTAWTGIYFLIWDGTIQYVGQSKDVHVRIRAHAKEKRIKFDRAVWIECDVADLDYLEAGYIRQCRPPYNRGIYRRNFADERTKGLERPDGPSAQFVGGWS